MTLQCHNELDALDRVVERLKSLRVPERAILKYNSRIIAGQIVVSRDGPVGCRPWVACCRPDACFATLKTAMGL